MNSVTAGKHVQEPATVFSESSRVLRGLQVKGSEAYLVPSKRQAGQAGQEEEASATSGSASIPRSPLSNSLLRGAAGSGLAGFLASLDAEGRAGAAALSHQPAVRP